MNPVMAICWPDPQRVKTNEAGPGLHGPIRAPRASQVQPSARERRRSRDRIQGPFRRGDSRPATPLASLRYPVSADWYVGIGASAGGVQALTALAAVLRPELPIAYLVVVHISPHAESLLPQILTRSGRVPASHAVSGERVAAGRIYVAPPDHHMRLDGDVVRLDRGAHENRSRPAIDPLFRSLSRCCAERSIGVVLTGNLDDGAAGLAALGAAGGITVVQDPADALHPDMPRNALAAVQPDHITTVAALGPLLARLVGAPPVERPRNESGNGGESSPSSFSCPDCGGVLNVETGPVLRFRCRVGHAYGPDSLFAAQTDTVDEALWAALRALEEKASIAARLARRARHDGLFHSEISYSERSAEADRIAAVLRGLLLHGTAQPIAE